MTAKIIDGKQIAAEIRSEIAAKVAELKKSSPRVPGLAVVIVGEDPASHVYVSNKEKFTREVGMNSYVIKLPASTTENELLHQVHSLNKDNAVHGMIVQLPLPKHIREETVINAIDPKKDVDGFHISNVGLLATGQESGMTPCTPTGCMILIKSVMKDLAGKDALVIGRSNIVGKPMAQLLLRESCTITIAHSKTHDLEGLCMKSDIIVSAVGKARLVRGSWVKPGACVIDVGMNRIEEGGKSRLCGDVDFEEVKQVAGFITPVPGGVGPMTIACLLQNTLKAFQHTSY